jgi:pSer/pThr/pTyr-binding forkhead associated (FHA) protein/thioredoxin reductase/ferredoxin
MSPSDFLPDGMLVLDTPVTLPPVLDALIVGGGPVGTAAAFRAKELGFSALVIDYDGLMKRIRDYPKDKQILPDFGGGDHMQFPRGGDLVRQLQFTAIDKDALCADWKRLYRQHNVPAQIGLELTGLARDKDLWRATIWNHNTKADTTLVARHVVIGVGRGVPRRLDIPGNVAGLAFQLTDAARYVGRPACVIGGGTSAAEAVIAISNAKVGASDESGVFWSYRGDKMPKVSKALADVFFEAYLGNGNVRYLPKSEPTAVMTTGEGQEFLCVRIDRKLVEGRPCETVQLEFLKADCIACIGEDIPEALLNSFGIFLVTGGPSAKKRMVVSPLLESQLPNVYLTGDMLSPAYLEADDFEADPATFREVKRRGNIKAAMRDGVFVAEVIAQKLAGKRDINVALEFEDASPAAVDPVTIGAQKTSQRPDRPPLPSGLSLVRLLPGNVEADSYPVSGAIVTIGRIGCDINFPSDALLSDRHAALVAGPDGYELRDEGSASGLFLRLKPNAPMELAVGGILRAGQQWIVRNAEGTLAHYAGSGQKIATHPLREGTIVIGREAPDITLDPTDGSLSRRHFAVVVRNRSVTVSDLGSANGTLLKVTGPIRLHGGDQICLGTQVLQFTTPSADDIPSSIVNRKNPEASRPVELAAAGGAAAAPAGQAAGISAPVGGPSVTFQSDGKTCPIRKDQTICQLAEAQGVPIQADCHQGICGSDPIRIVSGAENLTKMGDAERSALEDICSLSPKEHRLACMARVTGPVAVDIL